MIKEKHDGDGHLNSWELANAHPPYTPTHAVSPPASPLLPAGRLTVG